MSRKPLRLCPWTPNKALRATGIRITKIQHLLEEIAHIWGDIDQGAVNDCDELRERVQLLETQIIVDAQEREGASDEAA